MRESACESEGGKKYRKQKTVYLKGECIRKRIRDSNGKLKKMQDESREEKNNGKLNKRKRCV